MNVCVPSSVSVLVGMYLATFVYVAVAVGGTCSSTYEIDLYQAPLVVSNLDV